MAKKQGFLKRAAVALGIAAALAAPEVQAQPDSAPTKQAAPLPKQTQSNRKIKRDADRRDRPESKGRRANRPKRIRGASTLTAATLGGWLWRMAQRDAKARANKARMIAWGVATANRLVSK